MDDRWPDETKSDQEEPAILTGGLSFRNENVWVDGVLLTPHDCPECLLLEESDCDLCEFFEPEDCRLLRDPSTREDLRDLFDIYRVRTVAQRRRLESLLLAIRSELQAHGRPLHYTVLARMVTAHYPRLRATEHRVRAVMAWHPEVFECVEAGVYRCRSKS